MWRVAPLLAAVTIGAIGVLAGCGSQGDSVAKNDPNYAGSVLFAARCGGCHTLNAAGTHGSGTSVRDKSRINGPNFNVRKETVASVLYAIRNGGFSGAIMPQNVVVGAQAKQVAAFVAKYAGSQAKTPPSPTPPPANGTTGASGATGTNGATGTSGATGATGPH